MFQFGREMDMATEFPFAPLTSKVLKTMERPTDLSTMDPNDQERFRRLTRILGDLNRRLFEVEEILSDLGHNSLFASFRDRYVTLVLLVEEVRNGAMSILRHYGL